MKSYIILGVVALGVVTVGTWWIIKESLKDIESISKEPMSDDVTQEQLEALREKFRARR